MAANTGEDHVDDPAIQQNIQQSAEDSPQSTENENISEELQTTNHQLQTEEMEVHKHPHHVTHKKKWAEYLLEFFMLFLAVFLGFVAENVREHFVDTEREHQYVEAFIRDLSIDTTSMNSTIRNNIRREKLLDSILMVSNTDLHIPANAKQLVRLFMLAAYRPAHSPSSIAVSQLKNTGSFRLLNHKNGVADSILMYDKWNERIIEHNAFYGNDFDLYWAAFYPICDVKIFRDPAYATFTAAKRTLTDKPVPPLHLTQQTLSVFTGHTTRQVLINQVNRLFVQNQLQKATRLIDFLKKEYHLTKN